MKSIQHIQRVYYLIIFLFWFAMALPMALFVLLAQARGLTLFHVGMFMGVFSLTIVLLEVPTGELADAIGRKRVAVIAYIIMTLGQITFLFAFSFTAMLISSILSGVGRALSSGALDAWFVDALQAKEPEVELQPALAKAGTVTLLALGIGTLLGSIMPYLFSGLPADGAAVLTPFSTPVIFAVAVQIILVAATLLLVKEERGSGQTEDWKQGFRQTPTIIRTGLSLTLHNPILLLLMGASLVSGLAIISLESFWQPFFSNLLGGAEGNSIFFGIIMGGNFLAGMAGNLLAAPLSRVFNKRYGLVCTVIQGGWGVAVILLALQVNTLWAILFFWLAYMNTGLINSPHSTLLNQQIPSKQRSSMLSIASLATYLGAVIGGVGLGYLAENSSISAAWIVGGAALMVSLGLYWRVDALQSKNRRQIEPIAAETSC